VRTIANHLSKQVMVAKPDLFGLFNTFFPADRPAANVRDSAKNFGHFESENERLKLRR
jgi:hypothetical protein